MFFSRLELGALILALRILLAFGLHLCLVTTGLAKATGEALKSSLGSVESGIPGDPLIGSPIPFLH